MTKESNYWFRAKLFGWGWGLPVAWQGWLTLLLYFALVALAVFLLSPTKYGNGFFLSAIAGLSLILVAVCWLKGEPPRWRWGSR